jgi:uncharacterized glyoxalase superfamily protein PhnB
MSNDSFPILSVSDLAAVAEFYGRLGFEQTYAFPPEGVPAFVTLERQGRTIGIAARAEADGDRFSYWVYVDDADQVDRTFAELRTAGSPTHAEPRTEPWGERVASVRDPDGNVVHIGATSLSEVNP